jgi:hypothetical protein
MEERKIKEEVKKAIVNLFKPFIDQITDFEEAVKKMNEDAKKTEISTKDDWKILDVNCLGDIIENDCDVQISNTGEHWSDSYDYLKRNYNAIIKNLIENTMYRYRLKQTEKTHEELAEEYAESIEIENVAATVRECKTIFLHIEQAFIAGRKSMEGE